MSSYRRMNLRKRSVSETVFMIFMAALMALLPLLMLTLPASSAYAEGSANLLTSGGNRPFAVYADGNRNGIPYRNVIYVYAKVGETLQLGSSAIAISTGSGRIDYFSPSSTQNPHTYAATADDSFNYSDNCGRITNRTAEVAGPNPGGGFNPCTVSVDEEGVWAIRFIAPGTNTAAPSDITVGASWSDQESTNYYVTAWDVTVRDTDGTTKIPGRVYTKYIAMNMGDFSAPFSPELFVQTNDGVTYRVDMRNLSPYIFHFFVNNRGFYRTSDNEPIYRSLQLNRANGVFPPGYGVHSPDLDDDANNVTQKIFFSTPASDLPESALVAGGGTTWLKVPYQAPVAPTDLFFFGNEGTPGQAGQGLGGYFEFENPNGDGVASSYSIIIDFDQNGSFDDDIDRTLIGTATTGTNRVDWDGRDGNGV